MTFQTKTSPRLVQPARSRVAVLLWLFPRFGAVSRLKEGEEHSIGRGFDCATQLPGETISGRHAAVRLAGGLLVVRDLNSRNGTRVNGKTITELSTLGLGDILRCGEWLACVVEDCEALGEFGELAPGLMGGASLGAALELARKLAPEGLPMAIEGPTGAGKERAAAAIHGWSGRRGEFVGVNCAAIPAELAESSFFGHAKGAFSGADRARPGYLRQADGGTLLLDEFAELPQPMQAKLLRALEESEVCAVGESVARKVDVLLLTASQFSLDELVAKQRLREDLAARLSDVCVTLPGLAQRREDILPLFTGFLRERLEARVPQIDPDLAEWLCTGSWRRNVRGLKRLARTMAVLHGAEPVLSLRHVPEQDRKREPREIGDASAPEDPAMNFRRVLRALQEHNGNVSKAATTLGMDRNKVRRILKMHPELDAKALRPKPPAE